MKTHHTYMHLSVQESHLWDFYLLDYTDFGIVRKLIDFHYQIYYSYGYFWSSISVKITDSLHNFDSLPKMTDAKND